VFLFQPVTGPRIPPERRQEAARTARLSEQGGITLLADKHSSYTSVKPVAWVRPRSGDELHWSKQPEANQVTSPPSVSRMMPASARAPHPALFSFQEEQAREAELHQAKHAASIEGRTSSSVYGAHTHARPASAAVSGSSQLDVNSVGALMTAEQRTRSWGTLESTSKRLGFVPNRAAEGTPGRDDERAAERLRLRSVHAVSYPKRGPNPPVVLNVPESLNRSSALFPVHPLHANISEIDMTPSVMPPAQPAIAEAVQRPLDTGNDHLGTAQGLGFGSRHPFHAHYVSAMSSPQKVPQEERAIR
jgi:hypothetical protein